jgi:hypothetical protein
MLEQRAMLDSDPGRGNDELPEPSSRAPALVPGQALVTVCGVPLEDGERVVFFALPRHTRQKLVYVLLGVLLAPLVVGLAFIAYGLMYERWNLRFVAITNRRIVVQRGARSARWLRLEDVLEVRARREAPAGAIATMATPLPGGSSGERTDPRHWANARAIVVHGRGGALSIDESVAPELVGPAIANAVWTEGYVERMPTAHYPS